MGGFGCGYCFDALFLGAVTILYDVFYYRGLVGTGGLISDQ